MIPIEQAALAKALLGLATNSETQAMRWAEEIIRKLDEQGCSLMMQGELPQPLA